MTVTMAMMATMMVVMIVMMMVMMVVMMLMVMMMVMAHQEVLTCCRSCTSSVARDNFGTRPTQNIVIMIVIMIVMLIMIMMLHLVYLGHPFAKARYLSDSVNQIIFEIFCF